MDDLDKGTGLTAKTEQDFLDRSRHGVWGHPLGMFLVLATTNLPQRLPALCGFFAASILLVSFLRVPAIQQRLETLGGIRVRIGLILTCCFIWGIVPGITLYSLGYHDQDALILSLFQAVFVFALLNILIHSRRLIAFALTLLFAPAIVGSLLHGGPRPLDCVAAFSLYLIYCIVQGKRLNHLYLSQISDNFDLSVAAYRDCLTGLPNRLYMNHAMETCVDSARERGLQIALLYIDLDGFKQINDSYSHKIGDLFLCEAASRIRQSLRENDVAARVGGDEFNVLLTECASEAEALAVASRVLADARRPVHVNGHQLKYSASIGVSLLPRTAENIEMLVRTADEAMYAAKALGKDRICMQLPGGGSRIVIDQCFLNALPTAV